MGTPQPPPGGLAALLDLPLFEEASMLVYDIQDLTKYYPGKTQPANEHIHLQIQVGEIFGILGDNGAGKSTLVRQMVNLLDRSSGKILLYGTDIAHRPDIVPQYVGYMPQESNALNNLTVGEALYFTAHLRGMSRKEARQEREQILELWQMGALRDKYSSRLSGGQKRLLRLAVATAGALPVLMLDEPTNDLDPQKRKLVWDVLQYLNSERNTTIIFITHDAIEAEKIIQRVGIMRAGQFVAMGRPSEIKRQLNQKMRLEIFFQPGTQPALPQALTFNEIAPGRLLAMIDTHEASDVIQALPLAEIDDFRLYSATLEDVYLYYATEHAQTTIAD